MNDQHEHMVLLSCNHLVRIWRTPEQIEIYANVYCPNCLTNRAVMSMTDIDELMDAPVSGDWWS